MMKAVILAGGQPSTITNDREGIPKPMAQIGEMPMLWHIMKNYASYGVKDFIICGGYKVEMLKDYFADFYLYNSDITVDLQNNTIEIHKKVSEDWKVTIVDTGLHTATGERINRIRDYIGEEDFLVSYGDCLTDLDLTAFAKAHEKNGKLVTMAVARPTGRNELVAIGKEHELLTVHATRGEEQRTKSEAWADANIYMFNYRIFNYLMGNYSLEDPLFKTLTEMKQIEAFYHDGFWIPVETFRDRCDMENLWNAGMAPWKVWE